ncbi:DUF6350 family protein [Microbacterium sp. 179-B 1A2 NHS]|uniref:cell division protein PerM n=1 Tax=Microbacterium sp. 179-B 1A2 NHS TaxID=3142383 RepID=UPI0039A010A6
MNRLLVFLLAALDALIVVAVGVALVLAPMTLLWAFGLGLEADWSALWPVSGTVWQLGHFVPVEVSLPEELLLLGGLSEQAGEFGVSLAPSALAVFTAVLGYRSGARAARAGAWPTGVGAGTLVVAVLASVIAATSATQVATVPPVGAILAPALVFGVPALIGALVRAWSDGDGGLVDAVSDRLPDAVQDAVDAAVRGLAICLTGLVGLGALLLALLFVLRGGEIVALTQAAHADLLGVVVLSLGAAFYLPTLVVWFAGFVAGPGFAVGTGTAVSPAGTSLGPIPGIPVLGVVPESTSTWLLLLALLVVGVGAFAGWFVRGMLLTGQPDAESLRPRIVALAGLAVGSALGAATLAWAAQGALGPGRMAELGPEPGALALAVGLEIGLGAAIMLFSPRPADEYSGEPAPVSPEVSSAAPLD